VVVAKADATLGEAHDSIKRAELLKLIGKVLDKSFCSVDDLRISIWGREAFLNVLSGPLVELEPTFELGRAFW